MNFPRVLIISQTFDNYTGPGITLKNLFMNWPYESIAIISGKVNEDWSICGLQYLIGHDETSKTWPFSLLQERTPSTIIRKKKPTIPRRNNSYLQTITKDKKITLKQIILNPIKRILYFAGISFFYNKIKLSEKLSEFIDDFNPEIIYTQPSSHEIFGFVLEIHKKNRIPIAIHVMDDLLESVYSRNLLSIYWRRKVDRSFRNLINNASVHLSISEAMSIEYMKRYGKNWIAFHNPVDKSFMDNNEKEDSFPTYNSNRILYLGRIGNANEKSILFFINTVIDLNLKNMNIEFVIYTQDYMNKRLIKLADNKCIKILPVVPHKIIPSVQRSAGALILPLDFSKYSQNYARYSMPTKATEYMASGVPILVFAPPDLAVTKYAQSEEWGYVVDREDKNLLKEGIIELLNNRELRTRLTTNAKQTVLKNHDAEKVREKFREALSVKNTN